MSMKPHRPLHGGTTPQIGEHGTATAHPPHPRHRPVGPQEFASAFGGHPAGVAIITTDPGDGPVAMTATSVFSISLEPALLGFSVSSSSSAAAAILRSRSLVVHLLSFGQLQIAKIGATSGIDRFADTSLWERLPTGEPYFPSARRWFRGQISHQVATDAATVVVVQALETGGLAASGAGEDGAVSDALVYHNRTWHRLTSHSQVHD